MKKVFLILLGLPILLWSLDKGDWGEKRFPFPILFFVPFILIYFFFPKFHKFARNIYLILTLSFIILLCVIFIKAVRDDGKPNYSGASSNTTATDTAANWKTYTNNSYHLEFKYPQNFSFNENSDKIEINSPLSICNPPLVFNIEEYKQMHEVQIIIKKHYGSLEKILAGEGGKNYGWESKSFNGKPGFSIAVGAEMITPYTRFQVESYPGEVLDIQAYIFGSGDQVKCIPKLDITSASTISKQILSTFKFNN